jgi:3-oxoacyl-[acyl-carrier protein] reductase
VAEPTNAGAWVALVTGAGLGLGREISRRLAADGLTVIVSDKDGDRATAVSDEIQEAGGQARASVLDVADADEVRRAVDELARATGTIDVLVNNAAVFSTLSMRAFDEIPIDEWDTVMKVNISGMFYCAQAVSPYMKKARRGRIINLSSSTVLMGRPHYLHYVTSKSAAIGFTRSLARELGEWGITVNALMPGATKTEIPRESVTDAQFDGLVAQQSIHELIGPTDIAAAVSFMASAQTRLMTGQIMVVDGGLSFN